MQQTRRSNYRLIRQISLAVLLAIPFGGLWAQGVKFKVKSGTVKMAGSSSGRVNGKALSRTQAEITVPIGEEVIVQGNPSIVGFYAGDFEYIKVESDAGLKTLVVNGDNVYSPTVKLDNLDLRGATSLQTLRVYGFKLAELDLTNLSALKTLELGYFVGSENDNLKWENSGEDIGKIILPTSNNIETLRTVRVEAPLSMETFTKLKRIAFMGGTDRGTISAPNSPLLERVMIHRSRNLSHVLFNSNPRLNNVSLDSEITGSITITGAPLLTTMNVYDSSWGVRNSMERIDLSGNGLTSIGIEGRIFSATGLRHVNISRNKLPKDEITKIINQLADQSGKEGVFHFVGSKTTEEGNEFTDEHKAALEAKGWTVNSPLGVEYVEAQAVRIYPTVTSDLVHVAGIAPGTSVKVYALDGKPVQAYEADAASLQLSLRALPSGTYIVAVGGIKQRIILR